MSDTQRLIQNLLADKKLADSGLGSRVYQDEPILITASQMANYTPPQYKEMRKIPKGSSIYYEFDAKIFYEQGKFMADFEDEYEYQGEFARYYPTYQSMNDRQLRGYFSWRTKIRQGIIEPTFLAFAFVYIYELLNQIGVNSAEEGYHKLKKFWLDYRGLDPKIDRYAKLWLKDYVVYNNLDPAWLEDFSDVKFDHVVLTLLQFRSHSIEEVFTALNSLASYNLENSKFFKTHPEDVKQVVYLVFAALSDYYAQKRKNSICEKFFGKIYASPYSMFRSAVFYHQTHPKDYVYEINEVYRYRCQDGRWSSERFFSYKGKIQQIGALLKSIDFFMRQAYNFKSTLKPGESSKLFQELIQQEIEKYLGSKQKKPLPQIEIDLSQLQDIRQAALKTQQKLITEDEEKEPLELSPKKIEPENQLHLTAEEYQLLQSLLLGSAEAKLKSSQAMMLSVLIDGINDKLFDRFGDTIIIYDADEPVLLEDYIEELKGIIQA